MSRAAPVPRGPGLRIGEDDRRRLAGWAREAYPAEACGLLVGTKAREPDGGATVRELVRCQNVAPGLHRFELDPGEVVAADRAARAAGLELVGAWHTHPDGAPRLSARDRGLAWRELLQLVLGVDAGGGVEVRAWRGSSEIRLEEPPVIT